MEWSEQAIHGRDGNLEVMRACFLAMRLSVSEPAPGLKLLHFAVRALRISASTVAVVAMLRQQWVAGIVFAVAWLLIAGAPMVIPQLEPERVSAGDSEPPKA